jgi:transglutaminase-like putative cysteine protease
MHARTGWVGCDLTFEVTAAASVVVQVAATGREVVEELSIQLDGVVLPAELMCTGSGGRRHWIRAGTGTLSVRYSATVTTPAGAPAVTPDDRFEALLPSRYCPSDRLVGFAADRFGAPADPAAIRDYVHRHLAYVPSASGPSTDAIDTLVAAQGVCRDYAHLMVALCRAVNIPARVASVYAPGLSPMDFHLVAETAVGDTWQVWDATGLAPRPGMIRIGTGRDAADVAFATVVDGAAEMTGMWITAVLDRDLPLDDHSGPAVLP